MFRIHGKETIVSEIRNLLRLFVVKVKLWKRAFFRKRIMIVYTFSNICLAILARKLPQAVNTQQIQFNTLNNYLQLLYG